MNELDRYARTWGATAVPFGPLSDTQWMAIPSQQRAITLLDQTAALRGAMLLTRIFHKRSVLSWCRTFFPEIQLRRDLLPPLLGYETAFAHLVK